MIDDSSKWVSWANFFWSDLVKPNPCSRIRTLKLSLPPCSWILPKIVHFLLQPLHQLVQTPDAGHQNLIGKAYKTDKSLVDQCFRLSNNDLILFNLKFINLLYLLYRLDHVICRVDGKSIRALTSQSLRLKQIKIDSVFPEESRNLGSQ